LGCGGIIRNNFGEGVATFFLHLGFQTNHFVEASAACQLVKLAFELGITKLWLEGDSNNIINCINCITQPSWSIANLVEETRTILAKFKSVHITHVFREANLMAYWFAN
jgi:ribonuclease HI